MVKLKLNRKKAILISLTGLFISSVFTYKLIQEFEEAKQDTKPKVTLAYLNTKEPYLSAYEKAEEIITSEYPKGIIVNHHFFGGQYMAEIMQTIKSNDEKTVVLIAPNHFSAGKGNIQMQATEFNTPFGNLDSDTKTIKKVGLETEVNFAKEHGITSIVGFIKKEIPEAKVIPIMIKDSVQAAELNNLVEKLYKNLPKDSLIIASLDFAHYVPLNYALFQDQMAINGIKNFNFERIKKINIDSIPTLTVMLKLMDLYKYNNFNLVRNSSSSILLNNFETTENTSYITGYFSNTQPAYKEPDTINIFIGSQNYNRHPEPFRFISGADFLFLNYEDSEFNQIPNIYNRYRANQLEPFKNNVFSLNKGCQANKFSIQVETESLENKLEYTEKCLKVNLTKNKDFDLGINLNTENQTATIYYLPNSNTVKLKTNLSFDKEDQSIAKINF